jgi:sugar phosphate isomerase/epimerase
MNRVCGLHEDFVKSPENLQDRPPRKSIASTMSWKIIPSLLLALSIAASAAPLLDQTPGVVSFTFREDFKKDTAATLDSIKALGITDIEFSDLFGHTAAEIRQMLDARGMTCSSYGTSFDRALHQPGEAAADAKILGAKFVRVAWIPHEGEIDLAFIQKLAADFNQIGKALQPHGLTFCYHNHGFEFAKYQDGTLYDQLLQLTDPDLVSYELDILWAYFPGADPAKLIEKYGRRFKLMHVKDLKKGVIGNQSGGTPGTNDVTLGTGQIDLPAILTAARKANLAHYYIEDESPQPHKQVPLSLEYLTK